MGLRIYACSAPELLPDCTNSTEADIFAKNLGFSMAFRPVNEPLFIERCSLPSNQWFATEVLASVDFGYREYNQIRNDICKAINGVFAKDVWIAPRKFVDMPLIELINFSDCSGVFDYENVLRIYEDLNDHKETAKVRLSQDMYTAYMELHRVFAAATFHGGIILFS